MYTKSYTDKQLMFLSLMTHKQCKDLIFENDCAKIREVLLYYKHKKVGFFYPELYIILTHNFGNLDKQWRKTELNKLFKAKEIGVDGQSLVNFFAINLYAFKTSSLDYLLDITVEHFTPTQDGSVDEALGFRESTK